MKRFIVSTDFSPASHNAALYAGALARDSQASLLLVNVYLEPAAIGEVPSILMATNAQLRTDIEELLEKEALHLRNLYNIPVTIVARQGFASLAIQTLCEQEQPDLLVMGMKGMGGSNRWLGSTTTHVIRKITGPVLVVPEKFKYAGLHTLTLASDLGEPQDLVNYMILKDIALTFDAKIQIIHIRQRVMAGETMVGKESPALEKLLCGIKHDYNFLIDASVEDGVKEFLKTHPTDLLVVAAHKHNLFDRMVNTIHSTALSYESAWPLLVLQDK